jgi:ribonucleoside-diphosphate reductase alpha chain
MTITLSDQDRRRPADSPPAVAGPPPAIDPPTALRVRRRDGDLVPFDSGRIAVAISKAFLAVQGESAGRSSRVRVEVGELTGAVTDALDRRHRGVARPIEVEEIQDQVELALMRGGQADVARAYILYREEHRRARQARAGRTGGDPGAAPPAEPSVTVVAADGSRSPLDRDRLRTTVFDACAGLAEHRSRAGPGRDRGDDLRRHLGARARPGAGAGRPRAGRDRAGVLPGGRPAAGRRAARGGADVTSPDRGGAGDRGPR